MGFLWSSLFLLLVGVGMVQLGATQAKPVDWDLRLEQELRTWTRELRAHAQGEDHPTPGVARGGRAPVVGPARTGRQ